jgi:cytochrome c oxidase subunit 2
MSIVKPVWRWLALALLLSCGALAFHVAAQPADRVIRIAVKKFDYTPNEIRLKKGVPVVLEFSNTDMMMGFSVPDLKTRADLPPGKVTRVRIVPDKAGTFAFFCDIFCGTGHEDMTGTIVVED